MINLKIYNEKQKERDRKTFIVDSTKTTSFLDDKNLLNNKMFNNLIENDIKKKHLDDVERNAKEQINTEKL